MRAPDRFTLLLVALVVLAALATMWGVLYFGQARKCQALGAQVEELRAAAAGAAEAATGGAERTPPQPGPELRWRWPLHDGDTYALTSPYGYRVSPLLGIEMWHDGLDIAGVWRAQVVAVAAGRVVEHWPPPDGYWRGHDVYGGYVVLEHEGGMQTAYAHLSWTRVHTDDWIAAGEVIGRIGDTGMSTGTHLHFEVRDTEGAALNPLLYVQVPTTLED